MNISFSTMQGQQLEAGEIPVLPFANDGSFLAAFHAMQQQQQQASVPPPPPPPASAALEPAESEFPVPAQLLPWGHERSGRAVLSVSSHLEEACCKCIQPSICTGQPSAAPAAAGAADQPAASAQPPATGAASTADPPQTNAQPPSKPKVVIKPKQSIVQVRMRPAGGVTKKKAGALAAALGAGCWPG